MSGVEAEVNEALKVPASDGVILPWHMLETREEHRAATTTANLEGGTMQWPIDDRLFGHDTLTDALGVEVHSVPMGMVSFPLLATGVAPGQVVEAGSAGAARGSYVHSDHPAPEANQRCLRVDV